MQASGLSEDINWLVLLFRAAFTAAETSWAALLAVWDAA